MKKKDSVALFEVISKVRQRRQDANVGVLGWAANKAEPSAEVVNEESPPAMGQVESEVPDEGPIRTTGRAFMPSSLLKPAEPPTAPSEPVFTRVGGRVRISVRALTGLVVSLGLVVALVLVFLLGRMSVQRSQPPAPGSSPVTAGLQSDAQHQTQQQSSGGEPAARDSRQYYLVIQQMLGATVDAQGRVSNPAVQREAEEIAAYCKSKGYPATVNSWNGKLIVWSQTGFSSASDAQATEYAKKIESLGNEYSRSGKRYDFRQRDRQNKLNPTFLKGG